MDAIDWLLDADPAIRWQAMRDLTDASAATIAAERARVPHAGIGAEVLGRFRDLVREAPRNLKILTEQWKQ